MRARFVLFAVLFILLASSISTAEEAQNKKVDKAGYQERESMSRSLAGGADKKVNPILQENKGTSPKEPPQPPSAPKGLRIQTKSK